MTRDELIEKLQNMPENLPMAYHMKFDASHEPMKEVKVVKVHLFGGKIKEWHDLRDGEECIEVS